MIRQLLLTSRRPFIKALAASMVLYGVGCGWPVTASGAAHRRSKSKTVAASFVFGQPVAVDDSRPDASEPGIIVDTQGRVFVNAPPGLPGPSFVWRSEDGGQSFGFVGPGTVGASTNGAAVIVGGGDSNVANDGANALYFIDLWLGNSSTAVSRDSGSTWVGQPFGTVPIQDRPWVAADPRPSAAGTVFSVTEQLGSGLFISESPSPLSGVAFVSVLEISDLDRGLVGFAPAGNLVTNLKGDTYNVYSVFTNKFQAGIGLSKLAADSLSAVNSSVTPADDAHDQTQCFPVVAVDNAADDNLYLTWCDPVSATTWNVRFASFNGSTGQWSSPVTVGQGVYPWVTAGAPGKVDIAWYSAVRSGYRGDPNDGASHHAVWDVDFAQSVNALNATASFTTALQAADGVKQGDICTQGAACSADRELGDFLGIAHNSAGDALISYVVVPTPGTGLVRLVSQTGGSTIAGAP